MLGRVGGPAIRQRVFSRTARRWPPQGDDGLAVVWRIASRKRLARLRHGAAVNIRALRPEGIDRDRERRRHGARLAAVHIAG